MNSHTGRGAKAATRIRKWYLAQHTWNDGSRKCPGKWAVAQPGHRGAKTILDHHTGDALVHHGGVQQVHSDSTSGEAQTLTAIQPGLSVQQIDPRQD